MPQLFQHHHYHPPPPEPPEPVPPIPPRTRSRPPSRQQQQQPPSSSTSTHQKTSFFRLEDLPSPDREWQLLENIGDGTYGEVFRVSKIIGIINRL